MFKKILVICSLLFSSVALASANDVIVHISNATGTDCILKKHLQLYGDLFDPLELPTSIFSDQSITITMKSSADKDRKAILLAYECGENFSATFLTDISPFQGMLISDGYVLKSNKMHLYFSEDHNKTGHISDRSPVKVSWRLTR
ncbi:MAG: hypothetical protein ACO1N3_04685 [Gammaproteobacteria bacterium]